MKGYVETTRLVPISPGTSRIVTGICARIGIRRLVISLPVFRVCTNVYVKIFVKERKKL